MASIYEEVNHEDSLKQDIVARQLRVHDLFHDLNSFSCTSCWQANIPELSPEYLLMLDTMKRQLYHLMGIMRDFFADWPIQCVCMVKLENPIYTTFEMTRYLCAAYENAYGIDREEEEEAMKLYQAIYRDAYKFHAQFVDVLTKCAQSHTFLHSYYYPVPRCVSCRYREDYSSSDDQGQHSPV